MHLRRLLPIAGVLLAGVLAAPGAATTPASGLTAATGGIDVDARTAVAPHVGGTAQPVAGGARRTAGGANVADRPERRPSHVSRATRRPRTDGTGSGESDVTSPVLWRPRQGTTWQWQLSGALDLSVPAAVYDLDGFETTATQVSALHARGRKVICYLSVGSAETYRPDYGAFPGSVLGKPLDGWPDERWLDIRRIDVLRPIMAARMDMCRRKGFDAVEPDNVDGYANASGFPLSGADQIRYNRMIAALAHERGLSVGLKNDLDQVAALEPYFDFAVNEQCREYLECWRLRPFLDKGKAVLHVEYELTLSQFCPVTVPMGMSSMRKTYDLDVYRRACPA